MKGPEKISDASTDTTGLHNYPFSTPLFKIPLVRTCLVGALLDHGSASPGIGSSVSPKASTGFSGVGSGRGRGVTTGSW